MGTHRKFGIKCANFIWSASFLHKMQRMENNFYCVIDNIEHDHLWRNSQSHFRMGFPNHVNFSGGDYECALMEFTCSTKNFPNKMPLAEIYICLNITAEPITGGDAECNLLRCVVVKTGEISKHDFFSTILCRSETYESQCSGGVYKG